MPIVLTAVVVRICVTWDVLLVLLNPPQDFTSCRAGARPGHPISGLTHCSKKTLFDHLVGARKQRRRQCEAESLGGLGRDSETLTWAVRSFSSCGPPPALQKAVPSGGRIVSFDDVVGLAALVTVVCVQTEPTLP